VVGSSFVPLEAASLHNNEEAETEYGGEGRRQLFFVLL
jgi:hypothetical protein